jgi:isopenicillin N synthase-like dioxygenase
MVKIPIIDFSPFSNGDITAKQTLAKQIYQACHEIGFMYLENLDISPNIINQIFAQSKSFFNLPSSVKNQQDWNDEYSNQGYVGIERERLNPNNPGDLKEALNITKDSDKNSQILQFYQTCTKTANSILQAFAIALELPEDFFTIRHNEENHTLRLLHYPSLQTSPKQGQIRAGEHSDYGSITLLFQETEGLEIQTASGEWVGAPVIPGTVVVNTGDLMQRWTNHVFCSTKHRVRIPGDDTVKQSRYSIAFFCHPNDNTEIACLDSCQKQHPSIYPPMLAGEYLLNRLQATY